MKRQFAWLPLLLLVLAGCAPQGGSPALPSAEQQATPKSSSVASEKSSGATTAAPAYDFVFSYSDTDPLAGEVYDTGTLTASAFLRKGENGYTGEVSIRRSMKAGDKATTSEDATTHEVWYDSVDFAAPETGGSGKVRLLTYSWQNMDTTSNYFDLPFRLVYRSGGAEDAAYTLQTVGDEATLTLRLQDGTELSMTGKSGTLPAQPPAQTVEAPRLLISDFGYSTNDLVDRNVYRVLCSAVREGSDYQAGIRLYRIGEKCLSAGTYTSAAQGEKWEAEFTFRPIPFDEIAYRDAGGKLGRQLTAAVSQMAAIEADGHRLILTICGEQVFLELPGEAFPGYFVGKVDTRPDAARIAEEEAILWERDYLFRTTPQTSSGLTKDDFYIPEGVDLSEEELAMMDEYVHFAANDLTGQSLWLPPNFVPMPNAADIGEQPLVGNGVGIFDFTMEGKWLEEMVPAYKEQFQGMRNFIFKDGEYIYGHYGATYQFDYGECHAIIDLSLIPYVGTAVGIEFCRSN